MNKKEFLLNYDVEQEQRELAPLAQALQDLARDCALVLPLFWEHLNALDEHNLDQPMGEQWPNKLQERRDALQDIVQVLNQLPQEQKENIRDSITEKEFGCDGKDWIVPINAVFKINGLSIPVERLHLGLNFDGVQHKESYRVELCNIQEECQQIDVQFELGIIHMMYYQANKKVNSVQMRSNDSKVRNGKVRPSMIFWNANPLRIKEVMFENEQKDLSRENGPAFIEYTTQEDGSLLVSDYTWSYNGCEDQGEERFKERLAVWQEHVELTESMKLQEQEQQVGIASKAKKKKL